MRPIRRFTRYWLPRQVRRWSKNRWFCALRGHRLVVAHYLPKPELKGPIKVMPWVIPVSEELLDDAIWMNPYTLSCICGERNDPTVRSWFTDVARAFKLDFKWAEVIAET